MQERVVRLYEAAREGVVLAQRAVRSIEEADREELREHYDDYLESEGHALAERLQQAHRTTCALLETMGMVELLRDFKAEFAGVGALNETKSIDEGLRYSPAADILNSYHYIVRATLEDNQATRTRVEVLRRMLRNTAHIVHASNNPPTKEAQVTHLLKEAISWSFPDAILNPPVPQHTKVYKPDIGVPSDRTAVEVKFVDSDDEARRVLGEIYTDMMGYAGDPAWASFTAVIYQTAPFLRQDQTDAEAHKVGTKKEWMTFVVTGSGKRADRKARQVKQGGDS
ncbi:MAG: hypothetical protein JNK30_12605 [Phenylobacterium sp.]|uniref:PD-(D/E)XK nuclease domain-containing protein n=1 Tax=Phenylobacterium sp. TaxID=1871053 RepID=UPI001A590EA5|nr:hypothetical protein [Phenylobacterium sp.]MBL8772214.1 hypothetical protein [Phenylobacterium sp.]